MALECRISGYRASRTEAADYLRSLRVQCKRNWYFYIVREAPVWLDSGKRYAIYHRDYTNCLASVEVGDN